MLIEVILKHSKAETSVVASPTQPGGGGQKNSREAKYLSSFKFEVKNRGKSITFAVCYFCVIFKAIKCF